MLQIGKVFGFVLLVVFAFGALVTSEAQAQSSAVFTASASGNVAATTTQTIGNLEEYFELIGRKVECETAHFRGTFFSGKNASVTVVPDYTDHTQGGNCRAGGTLLTTITENGCDFILHGLETETSQIDYTVHVELVCSKGTSLVIRVRNLLNSADACTITFPSQAAEGTLTTKNTAAAGSNKDDIDLSGELGFHVIVDSNSTAICGVESGTSQEQLTRYVIDDPITFASTTIELTASE